MNLDDYDAAVRAQFSGSFAPSRLDDIAWYRDYIAQGAPAGQPLLLAMGENWEGPSQALLSKARSAPGHLHGYQFSMWGEITMVETLMEWLPREYGLDPDTAFGMAACWSGTRGALFDLGRILGKLKPQGGLIYATPGYDYGDVMTPGGLVPRPVDVLDAESFEVDYAGLLHALCPSVAAVVLNVQHSPLGHQIPESLLKKIFERCLAFGIVPVFDDAHFAVIEPRATRVNGLRLWLDTVAQSGQSAPWYLVRSFGKQLNCNGWGIGFIAGPMPQLERWVLGIRAEREYSIQAERQWAIAGHLASGEALAESTCLCARIARNREALRAALPGFPGLAHQVCTPFSWFALPAGQDRARIMRDRGVLLGGLVPSPMRRTAGFESLARFYLGVHEDIFDTALARLRTVFRND